MLFWKILLTEFIAEMGDKTQLMLMAMTSRFKLRDIILGTAAAVLVLNGLAVLAGGLVSELVPEWIIKLVAALAFLYFSWSSLKGDEEEKEKKTARISSSSGLGFLSRVECARSSIEKRRKGGYGGENGENIRVGCRSARA